MTQPSLTKDQILTDLQTIYQLALDEGKWFVALRAKELQGKILGLFEKQRLPEVTHIADMTEDQLHAFVDRLEKNDPELKNADLKMSDLETRERDLETRELKIRELESNLPSPGLQTAELKTAEPKPPELKPP